MGPRYAVMGLANVFLGKTELGLELIHEGLRIQENTDASFIVSNFYWILGMAYIEAGDLHSASTSLQECLRLAQVNGERHALCIARINMGRILGREKELRYNEAEESILQSINASYNYRPEVMLRYLSREMDVPLSSIYRIATFYTAFSLKPRGKHVINVCVGTTCHVKGAPLILETLERELGIQRGETTKDMAFTLEEVACLGCCGLAPVMKVGEDLYGEVKQPEVRKILRKYR